AYADALREAWARSHGTPNPLLHTEPPEFVTPPGKPTSAIPRVGEIGTPPLVDGSQVSAANNSPTPAPTATPTPRPNNEAALVAWPGAHAARGSAALPAGFSPDPGRVPSDCAGLRRSRNLRVAPPRLAGHDGCRPGGIVRRPDHRRDAGRNNKRPGRKQPGPT